MTLFINEMCEDMLLVMGRWVTEEFAQICKENIKKEDRQ